MHTTTPQQTPPHRQAWACAHAISQRRPVTLKRVAGVWEVGMCTGPVADLQRRKLFIERELKKIKPEEYGPLAQSLFRELTQIKKQIRSTAERKQ